MKKEYLNPEISLLAYVEEDILTTSEVKATKSANVPDGSKSVNVSMSEIIKLQ